MTKQGSFKRAVRERADRTGQRYTRARADLETADRQAFVRSRPFDPVELAAHLGSVHSTRVRAVAPIDDDPRTRPRGSWPGHYPSTLVVEREDGPPWIARVFSSPADTVDRVRGDADILTFLAEHDYPAERLATSDPVSVLDGHGVIVTDLLPGGRPTDEHGRSESVEIQHELGSLLGRLHVLPPGTGAVARDGGAEETDGGHHVGRPGNDLAAAMAFLVSVEDAVADDPRDEAREGFHRLRSRVEDADDAEGLPEALTHTNFHVWATVGRPGDLAVTGWAGSGRGPRLPALAWMLTTAAEVGPQQLDAALAGYVEHVRLTDDELDRLPGVLAMRPTWLGCLEYRETVRHGTVPTAAESWPGWAGDRTEHDRRITERVRSAVRSG